jgi:hypothetical protein
VGTLAALAMCPALAAAAGPITDDTVADFGAGAPGAGTWVVEPGSVQLKPTGAALAFDALPGDWAATQWTAGAGGATFDSGTMTVDGARVTEVAAPTATAPRTLEFRATFGTAGFQNVGFGDTFEKAPWAMFSTGGAPLAVGLYARTLSGPGATPQNTLISPTLDGQPHVYRIEWTPTDVRFYVDGVAKTTPTAVIAAPMRPVISDFTAGDARNVKVDWLGVLPEPASGAFESRVFEATSTHTVWSTLTPIDAKPADTAVAYATRTGNTSVPDATWSAYQAIGPAGAIQSPAGRFLQYRATMTSADGTHTPSLEKVDATYEIDETAPLASIDGVAVVGTTATVSFSSGAGDVARFECSVDGGTFSACTSPKQLTGMTPGPHAFSVRAVDKAANTGAAAAQSFTIVQPPATGGGGGGTKPPTGDTTAPRVRVLTHSVRATRHGGVSLRLACPRKETWCKVRVRLQRGGNVLAGKRAKLPGGERRTVTLKLSKSARAVLGARKRMRVTVTVVARDPAGNTATTSGKLQLLALRH